MNHVWWLIVIPPAGFRFSEEPKDLCMPQNNELSTVTCLIISSC